MPRARSHKQDTWQTAVTSNSGGGCLSFYILPPFAALLITCLLSIFALTRPIETTALQVNSSTAPSQISPIFTREVQHWAADIVRWSNASSVDPNLAAVVMQIESCGDPRALSSAGAAGLFQVMPFHFRFGENLYNPDTNALRGMNYLARSLAAANGNPRLALAGYNGGIGVISRAEWAWSAQTQRYVRYGAPVYEDARNGATQSAMLDEWYRKYGAGLCRQAARRLGLP